MPRPKRSARGPFLGVSRHASHAEIIEAHRNLVSKVHPDRGGTSDLIYEANAARDLLLSGLQDRNLGK